MRFYLVISLITFLTSIILTWLTIQIAKKFLILDHPNKERKLHRSAIPLLGGLAIFFSFFLSLWLIHNNLLIGDLKTSHWFGFFIGAIFLMIGGWLDDKYDPKPSQQIVWPVLAALAVIGGGVSIEKITNPLGGFFYLNSWTLMLGDYSFYYLSAIIIFLWLLGMMYATKLLDGIDGLVTGVTTIGALIIFLFTMTTRYYQPDIGLAALILAAACLGFLIFNFYPAKIFLGEGGSLFLGFALGVLAIISGGKIAIALLIMGLPILDVFWTIGRRLIAGKNPFSFADRQHLHFRLLDLGLGQKKTAWLYYGFSALFGLSALFLQSLGKFLALIILLLIMLLIIIGFNYLDKKSGNLTN